MKKIKYESLFSDEQLNRIKELAVKCGLLEDTVKILFGRGADSEEKIEQFIHPSKKHFISPYKMSGMKEAVELIKTAKEEEWAVVVYGDYDADGICASTIMGGALKDFGIEPYVFVPERRDGYGLNTPSIDAIFEEVCPQLFITVDCGISCAEEVEYIKEQGAEVIITDHHELPDKIPDCICVNPKFNDGYIYDNLCGAGVAFKVACALLGGEALKYIDFAAIATIADSVSLTGENRDIVYEGLKLINSNPKSCYNQFISKTDTQVTAQTVAFSIAPKINAAGRMGDAMSALNLFSETDENKIFDLSAKLTAYNIERQKCCDELYSSAKSILKQKGAYGKCIMLYSEDWNAGFVGIVAARLAEEYSRPVLLFVRNGDMLKGSARSIENINIFEALKACSEYIEEFGGHSQAAGVNVSAENFEKLENALNSYLAANYGLEDFIPTLYINGNLNSALEKRFVKELELLEPCGVGNRRPLFETDGSRLDIRPVKPASQHLTLKNDYLDFMYFGGAKYLYLLLSGAPKKLIFEYNVSNFKGKEYFKGFIRDVVLEEDQKGYADEAIRINNIKSLAADTVECDIKYQTIKGITEEFMQSFGYGTVYIAHGYDTLKYYPQLKNLHKELFFLSSQSLADAVLISPHDTVDLSGYKNVIYLDKPLDGVKINSLKGKKIIISSEIAANNFIKDLPVERDKLLKVFSAVSASAANLVGADSGEIALRNELGFKKPSVVFALEVFKELNLITFEGDKLNVNRGVKTELSNSNLYNFVRSANEKL